LRLAQHRTKPGPGRGAQDATLDRSYDYDQVGRLRNSFTGASARAHLGLPGSSWVSDGPYATHDITYDVWGNMLARGGWGAENSVWQATYTNSTHTPGASAIKQSQPLTTYFEPPVPSSAGAVL